MDDKIENKNPWKTIGVVAIVLVVVAAIVIVAITLISNNRGNAEGPQLNPPPPAPGLPSATASVAVNIRSGPGTQFPSFGVAQKGAVGEVIGVSEARDWWVVKLPVNISISGQGWVSGEFVRVSNVDDVPVVPSPPLPPNVNLPQPPTNTPTATALDAINVRSGPGVQYAAYGIAAKGTQGEVIGRSEDGRWWVVRVPTTLAPSGQAWVSADWVKTRNTNDVPVVPAPPL